MKARYPAFLSKNPTVLGLNFIDLILVGLGLVFSLTFSMDSLFGTIATISLIALNKWIAKYIDLKAWIIGFKTEEIDWMDSVDRGGR